MLPRAAGLVVLLVVFSSFPLYTRTNSIEKETIINYLTSAKSKIYELLVTTRYFVYMWFGNFENGDLDDDPRVYDMEYNIMGGPQDGEERADFWSRKNMQTLKAKLNVKENKKKAKNVIFFIGDGMSLVTVVAGRLYHNQKLGEAGEEGSLFFENFPYTGFSKTYCVDMQVADSACSGTAYWTGVKANFGTLGVTADVLSNDTLCRTVDEKTSLDTLLDWSQNVGKLTGLVTNTRITDASPAAGYAKVPLRDYEYDSKLKRDENNETNCVDIAKQLVSKSPGKNINVRLCTEPGKTFFLVIMGGGREYFLPKDSNSAIYPNGKRLDENLVEQWKNGKKNAHFITSKTELDRLDVKNTDYLLGLFSNEHLPYEDERDAETPSLTDMTEAAIQILSRNAEDGFFLFVEGGKIDHAHHETKAMKALSETEELASAIESAYRKTNPEETLIVVSADHGHTLSFSGYPKRGTDILDFAGLDIKGDKYTSLSYANGPNQNRKFGKNPEAEYFSGVHKKTETHAGDDVPVYSTGPWAHLLTGTYEQTMIPTVISYAACIGSFKNEYHCPK